MSIRLRLTLLYSIILALTLILFSTILYVAQAQYTLKMVRDDLQESALQIVVGWKMIPQIRGRIPAPNMPPRSETMESHTSQDLQRIARGNRSRDIIRVLDANGVPLELPLNENTDALPLSRQGLAQLRGGRPQFEIIHEQGGRLLVYNHPVMMNERLVGIVQAARSLVDRDRALNSLRLTLLTGSALITLIAFAIGWTLAGVTLRPIHKITQTAREIGQARDFSSRVHHTGPNDELGHLAKTFNEMLEQLEDGYQKIAHALQVQKDFVADVSHELRTPLTTIRGNLALLQRNPPLPYQEQEDILTDLIDESERLTRLVSDLLTLARADTGRKLDLAPLSLSSIVEDVCRQARLLAPERAITINNNAGQDLTARVNEDALKQVLLILLDNAIKHTRGDIQVVLDNHEEHVTISIQDDGPGMPPDLQQRVFDRFYRGDTSRSTLGFGLGLSIARALTEAQDGTITLESEIGQGSTFTIRFPLADSRPVA